MKATRVSRGRSVVVLGFELGGPLGWAVGVVALIVGSVSALAAPSLLSGPPRVSVTASGDSTDPVISLDGEWVLFASSAGDLVTNEVNRGVRNVFLRSVKTANTRLVSANTNGASGNGPSGQAVLSPDGRWVAFVSSASDLVPGDTNGQPDVFLHRPADGLTVVASAGPGGVPADGESAFPVFSGDSHWLGFESRATNLGSGRTSGVWNVFVREVGDVLGEVRWLSPVSSDATVAARLGGPSRFLCLSEDGATVLFASEALNLTPGVVLNDFEHQSGFFFRRPPAQTNRPVNLFPAGLPSAIRLFSEAPSLSADGRYAAMRAASFNLNLMPGANYWMDLDTGEFRVLPPAPAVFGVPGPWISADGQTVIFQRAAITNLASLSALEVWAWNAVTGESQRVSEDGSGFPNANDLSAFGRLLGVSRDGGRVAFLGGSTDPGASGTDGVQVLVRHRASGELRRISRTTTGDPLPDNGSVALTFSDDGRRLAFTSRASEIVEGDRNEAMDVFVYDWDQDRVELVSARAAARPALAAGGSASISAGGLSAGGSRIVYLSAAPAASLSDTNQDTDVFVRDSGTGSNLLVSVNALGTGAGNAGSREARINLAGDVVVFSSMASNLVTIDTYPGRDVFRRDLTTGTTMLVSRPRIPERAPGPSANPAISPDGNWVAFETSSQAFAAADGDNSWDIYLYDHRDASLTLVTRSTSAVGVISRDSLSPVFSADNRWLVFESRATDLIQGTPMSRGPRRVFARDLGTGKLRLLSLVGGTTVGITQNIPTGFALSAEGGFAVFLQPKFAGAELYLHDFAGAATVLITNGVASAFVSSGGRRVVYATVPSLTAGGGQIRIVDRGVEGPVRDLLVSAAPDGREGDGSSSSPVITPDGRFVLFASKARNLVAGVANEVKDIFLRDLVAGTTVRLSSTPGGLGGNGPSVNPLLGPDGRTLVFTSFASDLVEGDFNQLRDIFTVQLPGPESAFRVTSIARAAAGPVTLVWAAEAGKTYHVQFTSDLSAAWADLAIPVVVQGTQATAVDPNPAGQPRRFYRALKTDN